MPQQPITQQAVMQELRRRRDEEDLREHISARKPGAVALGAAVGGASSLGSFTAYDVLPWLASAEVRGNDVTHEIAVENMSRYLQETVPGLEPEQARAFSEMGWNSARRSAGGGGPEALARQQLFAAAGDDAAAAAVDFSHRPAHGDLDRMAQTITSKVKNPVNESAVFMNLLGKQVSSAARRGWLWGVGGAIAGGAAVMSRRKGLDAAVGAARRRQEAEAQPAQLGIAKRAADDNAGQSSTPFAASGQANPDVEAATTTPIFDIMASMIKSTGRRSAQAIPVVRPPPGYAYDPQAGRLYANMQDPGWVSDSQLMAFRSQEAARLQTDPNQAQAQAQAAAQAQMAAQGPAQAPGPQTPPEISGVNPY